MLDLAADEFREMIGTELTWIELMRLGLIENARDAVLAMGVMTTALDEPLVALDAKWHALEWRKPPEGLTDHEAESFTDRTADEADEVAVEIIAAPAKTLIGAYAHIALLNYWAGNLAPD